MNLYEAKRLVERAGYKVRKTNNEITKKDFVTRKFDRDTVEIDDDHDIRVKKKQRKLARRCPCCGKVHCVCESAVRQAMRVAAAAGYRVINEKIGDDEGTKLSDVCQAWLTDAKFEKVCNLAGFDVAKAQFLDDVKKIVGHSVSEPKFNEISYRLNGYKWPSQAMLYIAGLMQTAQGRGLNRNARRGW